MEILSKGPHFYGETELGVEPKCLVLQTSASPFGHSVFYYLSSGNMSPASFLKSLASPMTLFI